MILMMMMIPLRKEKKKSRGPSTTRPLLPLGPPAAPSQDAHDAEAETLMNNVVTARSSRR